MGNVPIQQDRMTGLPICLMDSAVGKDKFQFQKDLAQSSLLT